MKKYMKGTERMLRLSPRSWRQLTFRPGEIPESKRNGTETLGSSGKGFLSSYKSHLTLLRLHFDLLSLAFTKNGLARQTIAAAE